MHKLILTIALIAIALLTACNKPAPSDIVGETVTISAVTKRDPMTDVGGFNATATDSEGNTVAIVIKWKRGLTVGDLENNIATIVSVDQGLEYGTANLLDFGQINWSRR
jgi:hypothetical protein